MICWTQLQPLHHTYSLFNAILNLLFGEWIGFTMPVFLWVHSHRNFTNDAAFPNNHPVAFILRCNVRGVFSSAILTVFKAGSVSVVWLNRGSFHTHTSLTRSAWISMGRNTGVRVVLTTWCTGHPEWTLMIGVPFAVCFSILEKTVLRDGIDEWISFHTTLWISFHYSTLDQSTSMEDIDSVKQNPYTNHDAMHKTD